MARRPPRCAPCATIPRPTSKSRPRTIDFPFLTTDIVGEALSLRRLFLCPFKKNGTTLECKIPIRFTQAALGAEISIVGIDRRNLTLKIPAGIQSGEQITLRGEGMPAQYGGRGNLVATIIVETPVKLTNEQKQLLERFEQISSTQSSPKTESFFDNLKKFFG